MIKGKDQNGKPLYSITNGEKVGEINDFYLNADARQVEAIYMGKEGLLNRKALLIPRTSVTVFGKDTWLLSGPDVVQSEEDNPEVASMIFVGDLRGREIQTDGGTMIGTVGDVLLDENAMVKGFALGKVAVQGTLAESKQIMRGAVTDLGSKDKPMIIDLVQAEALASG